MTHRRRTTSTHIRETFSSITMYVILLMILASCAAPAQTTPVFPTFILITQDPNASQTPTPFQPSGPTDTNVPTFTPETPTQIPTQTFTPLPPTPITAPATTAVPPPTGDASRTNYILYGTLDFNARTISMDETIRYYNKTGIVLSDIVLSVQPN